LLGFQVFEFGVYGTFAGTPYEGGIFFLDIIFPSDYPFKPPKLVFKTRIYHCNVDTAGDLSVNILRDSWSPALTITKVLQAIRSIFLKPEPCKFLFYSQASDQTISSPLMK
jgi:ubiquitin-protein ligase